MNRGNESVSRFLRARRLRASSLTVPLGAAVCACFGFTDAFDCDALRFSRYDLVRDGDERRFRFSGDEFDDRFIDRQWEISLATLFFSGKLLRRRRRELEEDGRFVVLEKLHTTQRRSQLTRSRTQPEGDKR